MSNITGETVKKDASLALRVVKVLLDEANDEIVRHEITTLHDSIGFFAEGRASFDGITEHITRGQVADTKIVLNLGALRALAGTWWPNHDDIHGGALGALVATLHLGEEIVEIDVAKVHL